MNVSPQMSQFRWTRWHIGIVACVFVAIFIVSLQSYADPDLWGHLRFGLDVIKHGSIVQVDPYSYLSEGYSWINHEWLMEVLMGVAWLVGRDVGLNVLRVIVYWLMLGIVFWRLVGSAKLPMVPALVVWLCVVATTIPFSSFVRPQIFTFLLFACTLIVIDEAEQGRYRPLWLMPIIVALWVNLHGGFLAGCGVFGVWAIAHLCFHRQHWRQIIPPVVISALATLVNPYGYELLRLLLETATGDRPEIADWQPLPIRSSLGLIYTAIVGLVIWSTYTSRQQLNGIRIGLFALVAIMPLIAIRHLPLMGIAFALFTAPYVGHAWQILISSRQRDISVPSRLQTVPLFVAGVTLIVGISITPWTFKHGIDVPYNATALLRASGFQGKLLSDFGWGQYLIWHLGPRVLVGMDGRRETVYPPDVYEQYLAFHYGIGDWQAILRHRPPDAVLVAASSAPANLLALHTGWRQVFKDDESVLFIRIDSPEAAVVEHTARSFIPSERVTVFP